MIKDPPFQALVLTESGKFGTEWTNWLASAQLILSATEQSGTTALRPTKNLWIGRHYFDTTLGLEIWVKQVTPSVVWVNGAGVSV